MIALNKINTLYLLSIMLNQPRSRYYSYKNECVTSMMFYAHVF